MKKTKTIPITLITGYLGSGKTTLVNYILRNNGGRKIAVIVNDIGEINIDERFIEKGGVVSGGEESLVSLSNGCICCTLREDLIKQLADLVKMDKFDYILIEASGICEPVPIAQTITYLKEQFALKKMPEYCRLDAIVSVADAIRLTDEFGGGDALKRDKQSGGNLSKGGTGASKDGGAETLKDGEADGERDIENLIIEQLEFCDVVILNKASGVSAPEREKISQIIRTLQPAAKIIPADRCEIDLADILDVKLFDFEKTTAAAGWYREFDKTDNESNKIHDHKHDHKHDHDGPDHHGECHDPDCDCHDHGDSTHGHGHGHGEHGHSHHHNHGGEGGACTCGHHHNPGENEEEGTAAEYGIGTFVYYRRNGFDRLKFENFVNYDFGRSLIRTKGMVYFTDEPDMSYVYEQAGKQKYLTENGPFYATMPKKEIDYLYKNDAKFRHDWDDKYGDRLIKLVFIGQKLDRKLIKEMLDRV